MELYLEKHPNENVFVSDHEPRFWSSTQVSRKHNIKSYIDSFKRLKEKLYIDDKQEYIEKYSLIYPCPDIVREIIKFLDVNDLILYLVIISKYRNYNGLNVKISDTTTSFSDLDILNILKLRQLTYLDLSSTNITNIGAKIFGYITDLKYLSFDCSNINKEGFFNIGFLTNLTTLKLQNAPRINNIGLSILSDLTQLKHLILKNFPMMNDLSFLKYMTKLESLELFLCPGIEAITLRPLAELTNFKSLEIKICLKITNTNIVSQQINNPNIKIILYTYISEKFYGYTNSKGERLIKLPWSKDPPYNMNSLLPPSLYNIILIILAELPPHTIQDKLRKISTQNLCYIQTEDLNTIWKGLILTNHIL